MAFRIGTTVLAAVLGELAHEQVDAIALPATAALGMDAGIAATVGRVAGPQVAAEARALAPAAQGSVCVTGGGDTGARYLLHCVLVRPDGETSPDLLQACLDGVFEQVGRLGLVSLAFPALGATFPGLDPQSSTDIIVARTCAALQAGAVLRTVHFTVCDRLPFSHFKRALKKHCKLGSQEKE